MEIEFKNKTTYIRCPKDAEFTFVRTSTNAMKNLTPNGLNIWIWLASHDDSWIINRSVTQKECKLSVRDFKKGWEELQTKFYLLKENLRRGVNWIFVEDPSYNVNRVTSASISTRVIDNGVIDNGVPLPTTEENTIEEPTLVLESRLLEVQENTILSHSDIVSSDTISNADRSPDNVSYNVLSQDIDFDIETNVDFGDDFGPELK